MEEAFEYLGPLALSSILKNYKHKALREETFMYKTTLFFLNYTEFNRGPPNSLVFSVINSLNSIQILTQAINSKKSKLPINTN